MKNLIFSTDVLEEAGTSFFEADSVHIMSHFASHRYIGSA
jgi:hypothetical protein